MNNCINTGIHPVVAFLYFLSLLMIGCQKENPIRKMTPVKVKTITVDHEHSEGDVIGYSGLVMPEKVINLSGQVGGTLERILVDLGAFVKKGELVAVIDQTSYEKQYEVQLAQAELAKENYHRIKEVFEKGSIAEIKLIEARSHYHQTKSAAEATYQNIRHTKIYAPISGYVGKKMLEAGDLVSPGMTVISLLKTNKVKASILLPDIEVNNYKSGDSAKVRVEALNEQFTGILDEISIQSNVGTPTYTAKINIENSAQKIKPGMSCKIYLPGDGRKSRNYIIPVESVIPDEKGQYFVYLADTQNSVAKKVQIQAGRLYDTGIEVLSGLSKADKLIISGYHRLTDNTPIELTK